MDFIQNGIYKYRYEKLAVHLQWQRMEELSKSFCRRNTFSEACVMLSNEWGQPSTEDVQIVQDTFGST